MQNGFGTVDRRKLCYSIIGLALNVTMASLPFGRQRLKMATADQEFLIINGWILTREDLIASELARNVIRLQ